MSFVRQQTVLKKTQKHWHQSGKWHTSLILHWSTNRHRRERTAPPLCRLPITLGYPVWSTRISHSCSLSRWH